MRKAKKKTVILEIQMIQGWIQIAVVLLVNIEAVPMTWKIEENHVAPQFLVIGYPLGFART